MQALLHEEPVRPEAVPEEEPAILRGESVMIRRLRSQIDRIAPYLRAGLLRGEKGSGKQLVARAIHAHGPCAGGPFVVSNATSLAETIAADNVASTASMLESAQGGTLYLDAVGEMPYALQAGFLRFIRACEERRARALGSRTDFSASDFYRTESRLPDMRILAATHRDLRTMSAIGQFRQDLYARLSVVEIFVPSLRQRPEDIPALAEWLLHRVTARSGQEPKRFAQASIADLESRPWPDNLRGLERVITHAAALAEGPVIEAHHLLALAGHGDTVPSQTPGEKLERLNDVIRAHVMEVLTRCGGNKLRAAELLGISRSTLYRMLDANAGGPLAE
jgi:DNA-binding NtrC family response regulator